MRIWFSHSDKGQIWGKSWTIVKFEELGEKSVFQKKHYGNSLSADDDDKN